VAGNQAFVFNASGAIGTLRCVNVGGVTQVLGYTNGAAGPDFQINIQDGAVPAGRYAAADFLL
jgi:hypothetical protein